MIRCVFLGYMWKVAEVVKEAPGYELLSVGIEPQRARSPEVQSFCFASDQKYFDARKIRQNMEFEALLKERIDLLIVGAFGQILSPEILSKVRFGTINFHPSRLPYYRGGSPLEEQIIQGETLGGVTAHWMVEEVDRGPLIAIQEMPIGPADDYSILYERGHDAARKLMKRLIRSHPGSWPKIKSQIDTPVYKPRTREDGQIDWFFTAAEIDRLVRALGWRGWVKSELKDGKALIIEQVQLEAGAPSDWVPGKVIEAGTYPLIGTREGLLRLKKYKVENPLEKGDLLSSTPKRI